MPKLTEEQIGQFRKLIDEENIKFEGPIRPIKWPTNHQEIFRDIRIISRIWYDEFELDPERAVLARTQTKERITRICREAYNCRRGRVNEDTWRLGIEPFITARFHAEVVCKSCRNRLWISEHQALPIDPVEADRLQRRRAKRTLCHCDGLSRLTEDSDEDGGVLLFQHRASAPILNYPNERYIRFQKAWKPDRVFGLGITNSFKKYLDSGPPGLRHSPFADGQLVYPFLVIEAKSEKGGPGFESVEAQTAFPIRNFLKLQDDLRSHSGVNFHPLVWFLAFEGDVWRVYAATLESSTVRIIHLWQDTILSYDGVLQLLLIIDYICDWARDVYRLKILQCLAGGASNFRQQTPANTIISSWAEDSAEPADVASSSPIDLLGSPASPLPFHDRDIPMQDCLTDPEFPDVLRATGLNDGKLHPLLRWSSRHHDINHWTRHGTIRHSDLVLFEFRHLMLPEHASAIPGMIKASQPGIDLGPAAHDLLQLMSKVNCVRMMSRQEIHDIEVQWISTDASDRPQFVDHRKPNESVGVLIFFRTRFRGKDWQIVRELTCVSWNPKVALEVAMIAEHENGTPHSWSAPQSTFNPPIVQAVKSLRALHGQLSAACALSELTLILENDTDAVALGQTFHWSVSTERNIDNMGISILDQSLAHLDGVGVLYSVYLSKSDLLAEVIPGQPVPEIIHQTSVSAHDMGTEGAIIIRKPDSWDEDCPKLCLYVLREVDFANKLVLGSLVARALKAGDIYGFKGDNGEDRVLGESDRDFLKSWIEVLNGRCSM